VTQHTSPERTLGVGILSGTVAGLIAGIGARTAMRLVAMGAHRPLVFTAEGTLNIILIGTFAGLFLGMLIGALCIPLLESPRTRKYVPGPILRGLLVGIILFLLLVLSNFLNAPPDNDFLIGLKYLDLSLFGAVFIVFGLAMGLSEMLFQRYLPRKSMPVEAEKAVPKADEQ